MQRNVLVLVVALSVAFGAAAATAADHGTVDVTQEQGEPATVLVTDADDELVGNASVTVELADDDQSDYNGTGEYVTDQNGTVVLPAPDETVDVLIAASVDNESVSTTATLEAAPDLELELEQATGQPATVTVLADGDPAENASVDVETVDDNVTYAGVNETYTTDENGTIELPAPETTVNVTVSAAYRGAKASVTETLAASPELDVNVSQEGPQLPATVTVSADNASAANATVDVELLDEANASYDGTGVYRTDENGTVELPAPEETVDVNVTATYLGAEATITATLEGAEAIDDGLPFGQQLQQFKLMLGDDATGQEIASWVTENNPGNTPDRAGPGNASDTDRGPPPHAGGNGSESEAAEPNGDDHDVDPDSDSDEGNGTDGDAASTNGNNGNGNSDSDSGANSGNSSNGNGNNGNSGNGTPNR